MMKVLIVESEFLHQDTWVGNAVERLADALSQQNVTVIKSTSFDDGFAILSSNEAIDCLMFSYQMEHPDEHQNVRQLIGKLHERQQNVPVFLLGDREKALAAMDRDLLELVDEFAWILEDTADFIAGRAVAAMTRYRQQLLPPLFSALMKYSDIHEYSWAAPGHQGGVGFTKTPAGRFYHDYYGENLFRTDMGIERTSLGSLLDHTGAFGESEKYAARVFGADRSWSVVVGTSGSNRTIMQACMTDNDVVVVDRNCHKSIEQGLMLTGAKPVYMVPSRNRYGIIGPIYPQEMQPETLQKKISESPLTKDKAGQKPSYCVVTNCTYDGVCYNAKEAQDLLEKTSDRLHFDEAWYGYARFNPIYADHYAMRGEPGDHNGPTVFATHSTHKLLNALSQASYIHVREGRGAINFSRFNQAYMMHATTSPLYAICASNDVAVSMMDGNSGLSLTQEVIDEAVDFRQAMARLYKEFTADGSWFFKPWNKEVVTDPQTGKTYDFADAPTKLLTTVQDCWVMHPGESWHGFKDIPDNWSMLDPIKVSILAPGMGEDGELEETGVPAALVTAWLGRHGIVPTRTTDFQIMFLFSMGVTRGKWGTLVNTLCSFKRHYDANTPLAQVMPELVEQYPDTYANMGIHDLGDTMFAWLKENNPGARLNEAYSGLPMAEITPRETNPRLAKDNVVYFPNTASCGTATAVSVPCMFSDMPREHYKEELAQHQEGVLDIIQRAGINVLWNDNDGGCKGACDRVPHQNVTALNLPGQCINGECYDEVLFHGLEEYINNLQGDGVIVLHTIGSHGPTYYNRYPPQFRKFTPTCDTNEIQTCSKEQLVNTYDNTLVYVDYIVDKAINLLKEHQDKFTTSLVYLSDHGESLGENGIYLHGLPYAIAPDSQKQVPMLLWLSEDYQKRYQVDQNCLQKQAQTQHYSQDNLFSTLLGLTGVETKYYQAADDILQTCRRVSE